MCVSTSASLATERQQGDMPGSEPDSGNPTVRECVQSRLISSVGDRPTWVKVRNPVAWMAGRRETQGLKPIDKAILQGGERVTGP